MYFNLNGNVVNDNSSPAVDNGAFRYGYGLFETILMRDGAIQLADAHWQRLYNGMRQLNLQLPVHFSTRLLEEQILNLAKKNHVEKLCRIRLQVYAGGGGLYGESRFKAGYIIECYPLDAAMLHINTNGLVLGIARGVSKNADLIANLKSCNSLIYALAANQADENKWNDALLLNTSGRIAESTIANVFWIKDSRVFTPPLSEGCVAGVMRQHLLSRIEVTEQPLTMDLLAGADEVWLTNAIRKIRWVQQIEGIPRYFGNNVARAAFQQLFRQ